MEKGAEFSECRNYRYALWRIWDKTKPYVMFIGLNPSTADENTDDPTTRKVTKFAKDWGFGGMYMMNLFAWVTPHREELKMCEDPLGENDGWLEEVAEKCDKIIFAWGSFEEAEERAVDVVAMFEGYALKINMNGSPRHPLYIPANTEPVEYIVKGSKNAPFRR